MFFKTLTGKTVTIDHEGLTGLQIKKKYKEKEGITASVDQLRILISGQEWRDNETLDQLRERVKIETGMSHPLGDTEFAFVKIPISLPSGNIITEEFLACVNTRHKGVTIEQVQKFVERGGTLNIATGKINEKSVGLSKRTQYLCCCDAGTSRSQVAAVVLEKMGLQVNGVLAGRDSAMNPDVKIHSLFDPLEVGEDPYQAATNFQTCFNVAKRKQIGDQLGDFLEDSQLEEAKRFYQNYINQLPATHLITFGESVSSALNRLLQKDGPLDGFTITYCPLGDEIARPESRNVKKYSVGAYQLFANKLENCFKIV